MYVCVEKKATFNSMFLIEKLIFFSGLIAVAVLWSGWV